jgi:hypothetical protein
MPAQSEVGGETLFERGQPELLEAGDLDLGERGVGEVGQRRAAPQPQRLAEVSRAAAGSGTVSPSACSTSRSNRRASTVPGSTRSR